MPVYKHRNNPLIIELNTFPFLSRLSGKYGKELTLAEVPDEEWQHYAESGFDLVWLMGIWQRSPAAKQLALDNSDLRRAYDRALPGWKETDVAGSPYAVYSYSPDSRLGGKTSLFNIKKKLNDMGLGLILDFVPNHLAVDHPWTMQHPERFILGSKKSAAAHPGWFYTTENGDLLAYGRDPNFAPWTDTVQVNFFSSTMRKALIRELLQIASMADGVRCDMAMLGLNSVFQQTWAEILKIRKVPTTEFWADAITEVKHKYPDFLFIAEVYWGLDGKLRKLGFDYTYDKILYDRLRYDMPERIQEYIVNNAAKLKHMVHFIENHDEPRAGAIFGMERSLMAATVTSTIPGMRFFYRGQTNGNLIHAPVQLARAPEEEDIEEIMLFYRKLLGVCSTPLFRQGDFIPLTTSGAWAGNSSHQKILTWCWKQDEELKLIAINYSGTPVQSRIRIPLYAETGNKVVCHDEMADMIYHSPLPEVLESGLYVTLRPWQAQIMDIRVE
jgi:hypothetical protein